MPVTINGIGTTYFGKNDRIWTIGHCEHCGSLGWKDNHSTNKCFCVLFIPLIPYGKARIMNYCSSCTRHNVLSQDQYEAYRDRDLSEKLAAIRESDTSTEAVLGLCNALINWGKPDEARETIGSLGQTSASPFKDLVEARLLLSEKKGTAAAKKYRSFIQAEPSLDEIVIEAAEVMLVVGQKDQLPAFIEDVSNIHAESPYFQAHAGDILFAIKAFDQACDRYERLLALLPDDYDGLIANKGIKKAFKKAKRDLPKPA